MQKMKSEEEKDEVISNNLDLYNKVREVPVEAQKGIGGGRLKGMTDINPMWRIKTLTENFEICGIGWKAPIEKTWIEEGANGEKTANVLIKLFFKVDGEWSEGIDGIGGSALVAKETAGLFTSDECFKMAYTDAISVACKMLGFGADIYWMKDRTKYDQQQDAPKKEKEPKQITKEPETYASEPPRLTWTEEAVRSAVEGAQSMTDLTTAWNNADAETQQKMKVEFSAKRKELTNA
jgi:hypothetical protein